MNSSAFFRKEKNIRGMYLPFHLKKNRRIVFYRLPVRPFSLKSSLTRWWIRSCEPAEAWRKPSFGSLPRLWRIWNRKTCQRYCGRSTKPEEKDLRLTGSKSAFGLTGMGSGSIVETWQETVIFVFFPGRTRPDASWHCIRQEHSQHRPSPGLPLKMSGGKPPA